MALLQLIRLPNLLILAFCQFLIRYGFYIPAGADYSLNDLQFVLFVLCCCCLAAGGYVINDINDLEIDRVNGKNRPLVQGTISEKSAFASYLLLTMAGVGGGFYLSNIIGHPAYAGIFVAVAALLYLYASMLSSMFVVGNLLVSVLIGLSLLMVVIFDLLPATGWNNRMNQQWYFQIILLYAGWSFLINLLREWVKDLQDIDGDQNGGRKTLPIVLGRGRTRNLILAGIVLLVVWLIYQLYFEWYNRLWMVIYMLAMVIGPLILFGIKLPGFQNSKDYKAGALSLKLIMLAAICSIALLNLNQSI